MNLHIHRNTPGPRLPPHQRILPPQQTHSPQTLWSLTEIPRQAAIHHAEPRRHDRGFEGIRERQDHASANALLAQRHEPVGPPLETGQPAQVGVVYECGAVGAGAVAVDCEVGDVG